MRAFLGCFFLITVAFAEPPSVHFDGRELLRIDNPKEEAAGIRTYKTAGLIAPNYELGVVRIRNAPGDWPTIRESFLGVVRKKGSILATVVRGGSGDDFVVVDFAYPRPDGTTIEYAILRYSQNTKRELVSVDVRLRFPAARKDLVARIKQDRDVLVAEFTQLAEKIVK